jgi:hypothetical protein
MTQMSEVLLDSMEYTIVAMEENSIPDGLVVGLGQRLKCYTPGPPSGEHRYQFKLLFGYKFSYLGNKQKS